MPLQCYALKLNSTLLQIFHYKQNCAASKNSYNLKIHIFMIKSCKEYQSHLQAYILLNILYSDINVTITNILPQFYVLKIINKLTIEVLIFLRE